MPDQKLADTYAKMDKANEQFRLKESGIELLKPWEKHTAIAELKQTPLVQSQIDSQSRQDDTFVEIERNEMWQSRDLADDRSDISSLSISTLSGDELDVNEMQKIGKANKGKKISWQNLGFWDKAGLFNKWSILSIFADIFTIFGSMFYIMSAFFPLG